MPRRPPIHLKCCLPWVLLVLWTLPGVSLAVGSVANVPVGEGEPFVQFWGPREYGGVTECPSLAQDARGIMYVGNRGLILEYDGSRWRQIPLPTSGYVVGLGYDAPTDTVFVGTQTDLGYLKTEPGGAHTFVSLRDQLPEGERDVGDFFGVHPTPQGVYFVGTDRVLRWREGHFKTWKLATTGNLRSHWAADRLYVSSQQIGLLRLEGEEFVPASDDGLFRRAKVGALLAEADGSLLVATIRDGMFTLREGVIRPLPCECDPFLKEHGLVGMLRLRDGSFAVFTDKAELVLLDPARRFCSRVDRFGGLGGGEIYRVFEDAEGGLWAGMETGVARAEPDSPLSVLRARPDDALSNTFAIAPWNGTVVVGNNTGVFRLAPADPAAAASAHLEWVPETNRSAFGMVAVPDGVLFLGRTKVALLDAGGKVTPVAEEIDEVDNLLASRVHPARVHAISRGGRLYTLRRDEATGRWVSGGIVVELGFSGMVEMVESDRGDLWVGTGTHGAFRVTLDPDGSPKVWSTFDAPGPLHGVTTVWTSGAKSAIFLRTEDDRLWRFDDRSQTIAPLTAFGERFVDGSTNFGEILPDEAGGFWLTACKDRRDPRAEPFSGRTLAGGPGRAPVVQALPRKVAALVGGVEAFLPVEEPLAPLRTVLLTGATGNGLVRLDVGRWETRLGKERPFATLIRRAFTTQGEDVDREQPILQEPLPYARNTLRFEYAAGTLAFGAEPKFQTRLAGFGKGEWSEWSERACVDYLNLPEGRYTFEVRARNADGLMGSVASVGFRVLPPWQRSPWAYALYALAAGACMGW